jgi:hypothetical protein
MKLNRVAALQLHELIRFAHHWLLSSEARRSPWRQSFLAGMRLGQVDDYLHPCCGRSYTIGETQHSTINERLCRHTTPYEALHSQIYFYNLVIAYVTYKITRALNYIFLISGRLQHGLKAENFLDDISLSIVALTILIRFIVVIIFAFIVVAVFVAFISSAVFTVVIVVVVCSVILFVPFIVP